MSPASVVFDETTSAKPMRLVLALLLAMPLFGAGYVVEQTIRWTNHIDGLLNGLFHMAFFGIASTIYLIPWALIVHFSYRKRASQARRTLWMLGPSILMSLLVLSGLFTDPPTPQNRFRNFAKTELPTEMSDLTAYFRGGGVSDYGDTYYFKTSSAEIERLIREMKLEEDEYFSKQESPHSFIKVLPGCPDYAEWVGAKKYEGWDDRNHWFYHLITDSAKSQAYIFVGCT
jgi:hypothetical protein